MSAAMQMLLGTNPPADGPQVEYTVPGTYTWVCPAGVTSVSAVCVGAGGSHSGAYAANGAGGGALGYKNDMAVTPGDSYTVLVGLSFCNSTGNTRSGTSTFIDIIAEGGGNGDGGYSTVATFSGTGVSGGNGGSGGSSRGGGGAGGYSGAGGDARFNNSGLGGSGGGGGGGGGTNTPGTYSSGKGGGVGLRGQGSNGTGGYYGPGEDGGDGTAGSGGSGTNYGGGAGGDISGVNVIGGHGAVRIIWPGNLRQFPSTRTANE